MEEVADLWREEIVLVPLRQCYSHVLIDALLMFELVIDVVLPASAPVDFTSVVILRLLHLRGLDAQVCVLIRDLLHDHIDREQVAFALPAHNGLPQGIPQHVLLDGHYMFFAGR